MTPEEVFAQLRDIHSPDVEAIVSPAYDLRPLLVFAMIAAIIVGLRFWLVSARAKRAVARVDATAEPARQRDAFVRLLASAPRRKDQLPLPARLFDRPEAVTSEDASRLRRWTLQRLR